MASISVTIGGVVLVGVGLLFTWRRDLLARMGYDRALAKAMRPRWIRFMEIPIQIGIIAVGLAWVVLGSFSLR